MLAALLGEEDERDSSGPFKSARPSHVADGLEGIADDLPARGARQTAHRFKRKVDPFTVRGRLSKFKTHTTLAQIDQLAPIVQAEIYKHHPFERFSRYGSPFAARAFVFISRWRARHNLFFLF